MISNWTYDPLGNRVGATESVTGITAAPPTQLNVLEQGYMATSLAWLDSSIAETG